MWKVEKILIFILVVIAIAVGMFFGVYLRENKSDIDDVEIISIVTDKERYGEGETANIRATIFSSETREVVLKLYGIKNRHGRYYIWLEKSANLSYGENSLEFSATLPYCSPCAGILPGTYELTLEVIKNNTTIRALKSIYLEG